MEVVVKSDLFEAVFNVNIEDEFKSLEDYVKRHRMGENGDLIKMFIFHLDSILDGKLDLFKAAEMYDTTYRDMRWFLWGYKIILCYAVQYRDNPEHRESLMRFSVKLKRIQALGNCEF